MMLTVINFLANLIMFAGGTGFYLSIFTRDASIVHRWPVLRHWALRLGLGAFIAGSFLNMLSLDTPSVTQIILNVGLAAVFGWAVLFHYKYFYPPSDFRK